MPKKEEPRDSGGQYSRSQFPIFFFGWGAQDVDGLLDMPYLPDRPTKSYIHTRLQIGGSKSRSVLSAWWRLTRRAEVDIAIDRNFRSRRSGRLGNLLLCHQLVGEDSPPNLMSVLHIYDLFALPET